MAAKRVGVLIQPQLTTYPSLERAVREVEMLGVDTIWDWDHLYPPYERDHRGNHFEGWTLLTAMATITTRAEIGCMVTCNSYRNPALLANMAKTIDHISGGRLILGIGSGWLEYEYNQYGYSFGTARSRLEALAEALPIIKKRWEIEEPRPIRNPIPTLIGGEGEKLTLKLVAQYADIWNGLGTPERFRHKNQVLNQWCLDLGRDPAEIERSVLISDQTDPPLDQYLDAGASHIIIEIGEPWNFKPVEDLVRWRDAS